MGYSYTSSGKLICDRCGHSGDVRKVPCPFGWCPLEQNILATGGAVRCSALITGLGEAAQVHVLFRRFDRSCVGFYMAPATYHAIPLLVPATPDDYRKHGPLTDAPDDFNSTHAALEAARKERDSRAA